MFQEVFNCNCNTCLYLWLFFCWRCPLSPHGTELYWKLIICWHSWTHGQGRSCKQISWPPGVGGLPGVGLDPGQHDHHPHGVVHVGQLQVWFLCSWCGSEDCYFYHNSIWSIQYIIPCLASPQNINNHLLNSTDSTFHIWTSHHFLIYDIQSTHFISPLQAAPADQHLTKPGNRHISR